MKREYDQSDKLRRLGFKKSEITPLEVKVRDSDRGFESAVKYFKSIVQKEGNLSKLREISQYEKPSAKRRRKKRESIQKLLAAELKQKQIASGEWDKKIKRRLKKKQEKYNQRKEE